MTVQRIMQAGWRRGLVELHIQLRSKTERAMHAFIPAMFGVLFYTMGADPLPGTDLTYGHLLLPGGIAMSVFQTGLLTLSYNLAGEREDGTLLRLRGWPGGIHSYLLGKAVSVAAVTAAYVVVMAVLGGLFVDLSLPQNPTAWATLVAVLVLGLLAMVGLGASVGALAPNPRLVAVVSLPLIGLIPISGLIFPFGSMPQLVQYIANVFPLKWLAQGIRTALLSDTPAVTQLPGNGQLPLVFAVLAAWTLAGALLAPVLLRRTARRQSGSALEKARSKAIATR
ncbi:multidrug ABC transporter permease [Streptomyces noursei ATCC 11455]|uniref:ABC transporter permease n=1 Tax=Streptomyces noursei TaxID=1971 RepID=UPI00081CFD16|nr:multidrug ABC transporter permease [Streptomyces noursei ATCC 11455]